MLLARARLIRALGRFAFKEVELIVTNQLKKFAIECSRPKVRPNNSFNASGWSLDVIRKVECFSQFFPPR